MKKKIWQAFPILLSVLLMSVVFVVSVCTEIIPVGATVVLPSPTWTHQNLLTNPSPRSKAAMAYDPATGNIVLFGGVGSTILGDTWTWNGSAWTLLSPAISPPPLEGAAMAYDPATSQMLLFGGYNGITWLNSTWSWNGSTWTELSTLSSPAGSFASSGIIAPVMIYDTAIEQMLMFGAYDTSYGEFSGTWLWNSTAWVYPLTTGSYHLSPPFLYGSMGYDPATQDVVLFGGYFGGFSPDSATSATWIFNGSNWSPASEGESPPVRYSSSMVYDPVAGGLLLFGGINAAGNTFNDTWIWNGSTWNQYSAATNPTARYDAAMAYDPQTSSIVMFGGVNSSYANLNDTWTFGIPQVVGMAATPTGGGYWLADAAGGVYQFGNVFSYGSMLGQSLNAPVVGITSTPNGGGYWLVASDGGVFAFGNAGFYGSMGDASLNKPIVGMVSTSSGTGYYMAASDGGIFSLGATPASSPFYGSMGGKSLVQPVVGTAYDLATGGYWEVASDGGVFSFNAPFYGSGY